MKFLDFLFDGITGYADVVTKSDNSDHPDNQRWFEYPLSESAVATYISMRTEIDVWIAVALYSTQNRTSADAQAMTTVVYADADYCHPDNFKLKPSLVVQSSPNRYQCYWKLDEPVPAHVAAAMSHKIAVGHKDQGCDQSGWIQTKLLRVPHTTNTKHGADIVTETYTGEVYSLAALELAYKDVIVDAIDMSEFGDYPPFVDLDVVEEKLMHYSQLAKLYAQKPRKGTNDSWSDMTMRLACDLFRTQAFDEDEIFTLIWNAKANKFRPLADGEEQRYTSTGELIPDKRPYPELDTWKHVQSAKIKSMSPYAIEVELDEKELQDELQDMQFISESERERVNAHTTFIDHFVAWVHTRSPLSDVRLRRTTAYMLLSNTLAGCGYITPQFGRVYPNLWILSIGETSTSKKTTVLHLHDELLKHYESLSGETAFVANSFSIEKLNKELGERDGKVSLVVQDEIQGKFKEWNTKQWQTGVKDSLNSLYNGTVETAIRQNKDAGQSKKGVMTIFNFYGMGTPDEIAKELTIEDFQSGFMMRWLVSVAQPATVSVEDARLNLRRRDDSKTHTTDGVDKHAQELAKKLFMSSAKVQQAYPDKYLDFTDEALDRFQQWQDHMHTYASRNRDNKYLRPMIERLKINALKASALLAMSEGRGDIELIDILTVLEQSELWFADQQQLISSVSASSFQRQCNDVLVFVAQRDGRNRANLLRKFNNYRPREVDEMLESLMQQGLIRIEKSVTGALTYKAVK